MTEGSNTGPKFAGGVDDAVRLLPMVCWVSLYAPASRLRCSRS